MAVPGNCLGCTKLPTNDESTPYQPIFAGLLGNLQKSYRSPAPRAFAGANRRYYIYCGTQNTQVQSSLNTAINIARSLFRDYWFLDSSRAKIALFERLEQIFSPVGTEDGEDAIFEILYNLYLFHYGASIRIPVSETLHKFLRRSIVCATPTMFNDYGIASSYYDVCEQDPTIVAYHPTHSSALMLCPGFFRLPIHVNGRQCPTWNRFLQTFYTTYEAPTVEYQTYILFRGFLDASFDIEENIVVSPNPRVPNWNELILLPQDQKTKSSALFQLYVALLEQECRLAPRPVQDHFNQYIVSLVGHYLGKQKTQAEAAAQEVEELKSNTGELSTYEVRESSSGVASRASLVPVSL
ncbi:hypothetical protein MMC11_004542 [Xylographa trunciseda]|nr:hypothetical protein [Xylographa trunciseda]